MTLPCGQIRRNTVVTLSPLQTDPETGHDFVDDQQRAVLITDRT